MSRPPLAGLRVLVTRPAAQAKSWVGPLEDKGASVVLYPTIEVVPPPSWEALDDALAHIDEYDWVLFTSAAAARHTVGRLRPDTALGTAPRPRVAAVGAETARALDELGVRVTVVPEQQRQEGLATAFDGVSPGTRVLFPQAIGGREELRNALLARGCIVDVVPASQTIPIKHLPPPPSFDIATFASPSALRAFVAARGLAALENTPIVVIGPTTAAAASALGLSPVVADAPNVEAVAHATTIAAKIRRTGDQ